MYVYFCRYGKIFKSSLFGEATIVSADARFNKFILNNEGNMFELSYPKNFSEIVGKSSILNMRGDLHRDTRAIVVSSVSNAILRSTMLKRMEKQALLVLNSWKQKRNLKFSAHKEVRKVRNISIWLLWLFLVKLYCLQS